jgi:hypothetical protein
MGAGEGTWGEGVLGLFRREFGDLEVSAVLQDFNRSTKGAVVRPALFQSCGLWNLFDMEGRRLSLR